VRADRLTAAVTDDGRGISPAVAPAPGPPDAPAGYGLTTMRERAERWGGTVKVQPGRGSGTVVRVAVPLPGGGPLDDQAQLTGALRERAR
jgi:signal transduction histidine kinase